MPSMQSTLAALRTGQQLLAAGQLAVAEIWSAVGLASAAEFERLFVARNGMTPAAYRRLRDEDEFRLTLPAGFRPKDVLDYFSRDSESASEGVAGTTIAKALATDGEPAILRIEFRSGVAICRVDHDRTLNAHDRLRAHAVAARMLGLAMEVSGFERRARTEADTLRLIQARPGLRLSLTATAFEALVWAILGQQVNLRFATTLRRTVIELAGRSVPGSTLRLHPEADAVAELEVASLTSRKCSRSKAEYLIGAARRIAGGQLPLDDLASAATPDAERLLRAERGIGPWTARYVLLRGFGCEDCAPIGDSGLAAGLQRFFELEERPSAVQAEDLMQRFAPHRSLATAHFWASWAHARAAN